MKKFRTFICSLVLTLFLAPSRVFADGSYSDRGGDQFINFILWTVIIVTGLLGICAAIILIVFLLNKLGIIHLPPEPPAS